MFWAVGQTGQIGGTVTSPVVEGYRGGHVTVKTDKKGFTVWAQQQKVRGVTHRPVRLQVGSSYNNTLYPWCINFGLLFMSQVFPFWF